LCGIAALPENATDDAETEPFPEVVIDFVWGVIVPVSDEIAIDTFELSSEALVTVFP
jgi:hypothetical protein